MASEYIQALKRELRQKKVRYQDLAKHLGLSESGVKKLLNSEDIAMSRLQKILEILELSLSDLENLVSRKSVQEVELSEKQQRELIRNFDVFCFYWKIAVEKQSLEKIQKEFSLSKAQLASYLRKLDELNLIRWKTGQSFQSVHQQLVRWVGQGPLLDYINREWGRRVLEQSLTQIKSQTRGERSLFQLKYLTLTSYQIQELVEELSKRGDELSIQASREERLRPETQLIKLGFVLAFAPMEFVPKLGST